MPETAPAPHAYILASSKFPPARLRANRPGETSETSLTIYMPGNDRSTSVPVLRGDYAPTYTPAPGIAIGVPEDSLPLGLLAQRLESIAQQLRDIATWKGMGGVGDQSLSNAEVLRGLANGTFSLPDPSDWQAHSE